MPIARTGMRPQHPVHHIDVVDMLLDDEVAESQVK
jgi:hypothetical protein